MPSLKTLYFRAFFKIKEDKRKVVLYSVGVLSEKPLRISHFYFLYPRNLLVLLEDKVKYFTREQPFRLFQGQVWP
jgi:hypothetical protein